jgi:hypothetical protein
MKFNENIIKIFENFSELNPSIIVKEGNKLETISISRSILAEALLPVVFEKQFAIYNLPRFIHTFKLFKEPDFIFEDKYVTIQEQNKSLRYMYAEERTMDKCKVPENKLSIDAPDIEFKITKENIKEIQKAIKVLNLPNFVFEGNGTNIFFKADNVENPTSDSYSVCVGETDKTFKGIFDASSLKMMEDDYKIEISNSGISKFIGKTVTYYVVFDYKSEF